MENIDLSPNLDNNFESEIVEDYKTPDLFEASYLLAKGYKLIGSDLIAKTVYFVFQGNGVEAVASDWKFDPNYEMELVKRYNQNREMLFALMKTTKLQIGGTK
jgi:hypothetical protein